jgi:outer membrane receptor for ferrienterochelin and colicins
MRIVLLLLVFFRVVNVHAEEADSTAISSGIEEIVVTATKTATQLEKSTVPLSQIVQKYIKATGSIKLADLLQEQNGIQLSSFLGTGVQLQGMSADYTLILLNGEPIVGKTAGVVDLSRIVVSNIKKVEIVKGPVSCLYGSDAIGGVINIITEDVGMLKNSVEYSLQYKSPVQLTNTLFTALSKNKLSFENSVVYNFSNGYQTNKATIYKEGTPYHDLTINNKLTVRATENIQTGIGLKYYYSRLYNTDEYASDSGTSVIAQQNDRTHEFNFSPFFKFSKNSIVFNMRSYNSYFQYESHINGEVEDGDLYDDQFSQLFNKLELQLDYTRKTHVLTAGAGGFYNRIQSDRNERIIHQHQEYLFLQYQYDWKDRILINVGNRIDFPNDFAIQWLSPKASARFNVNKYFAIKISGGRGYKAPDIRQQYLNFTNSLVGYGVFGADVAVQKIEELEAAGLIQYFILPKERITTLKPEKSWAFNGEVEIKPIPGKMTITANYFRNQLTDMIEATATALRTNGALIYTYYNLQKIYTQGVEVNASYKIIDGLSFSAGYNFVDARDVSVLRKISNGEVFRRDPVTLQTERLQRKDYGGLFDRSRHSFNVKIYYENKKHAFNTYLRLIYKGKYGWADKNNNQILDIAEEYAPGYALLNFSFTKTVRERYHFMVGIDNMLNKKFPTYIPSLNGITAVVGIRIQLLQP